jgi:hypothetical protein
VCGGLSERQVLSCQAPVIPERDVRSDPGQALGSPPQSLSLQVVPYLSYVAFDPHIENPGARITLEASSTTLSSIAGSSSTISLDRTLDGNLVLDPYLQAHKQASPSLQSDSKVCELCQELFNGSKLLVEHLSTIHADIPNSCGGKTCLKKGLKWKDRRTLMRHLNNSQAHRSPGSSAYWCRCGKEFLRKDKFREHFRKSSCTGNLKFQCKCGTVDILKENGGNFETHLDGCERGKPGRRPNKRDETA